MEMDTAVSSLAALAHRARLSVFRLLVEAGPEGLPAGELSERLQIAPSSLSFHLKELSHAGLVHSRQQGRFVIYVADFAVMNGLVGFLTDNCCGGEPCATAPGEGAVPEAPARLRVLFLCTGNACRSQMAEGWAHHLHGDLIDAYSAGVRPQGLDERAVQVMAEAGIDLIGHRSKALDELLEIPFDRVVTVCDRAAERCPLFPGKVEQMHRSFEDPPRLAADARDEQAALAHYRRVRDEIRDFVEALPQALQQKESHA